MLLESKFTFIVQATVITIVNYDCNMFVVEAKGAPLKGWPLALPTAIQLQLWHRHSSTWFVDSSLT